jgi:putative transcriptional regulator
MPIIVNLDVMLAKRKRRLTDLANFTGITIQNLSNLKTGKARAIRFSTLESICQFLDCQPADLLEYQPSPDSSPTPDPDPADEPDPA